MPQFPHLEPGVTVTGATLTVTLSDGTSRTVDIPAEYEPDEVRVNLVQVSPRRTEVGPTSVRVVHRHEVQVTVTARFAPSRPGDRTRSFYRLN